MEQEYGVCLLSVVPVRTEASDKAEICTQLVFGDLVTLLDKAADGKWIKIRNEFDNYEGWVDPKQIDSLTGEAFEKLRLSKRFYTAVLLSTVKIADTTIPIVAGSTVYQRDDGSYYAGAKDLEVNGAIRENVPIKDAGAILDIAKLYLQAPYLWGGKSPFGIDCSGFVQQVFKIAGYRLQRDVTQQQHQGIEILGLENAKAGDIAILKNTKGSGWHVGILMENDQIIHASGKVRIDRFNETGIIRKDNGDHTHQLVKIKRIIGARAPVE